MHMGCKNVALEYCILACDMPSFNIKHMQFDSQLSNLKQALKTDLKVLYVSFVFQIYTIQRI